MEDITLTKQQIFNLLKIYENFKTYEDFTITLGQNGIVSVQLDSNKMVHKVDRTFIPKL